MGDFVGQGLPDQEDMPDSPAANEGVPTDDDAADDVGEAQADDVAEDIDDDADAEAALDEGADDEEGDYDGSEGDSPTFDKLLSKYGGNREKMAQAFFDQANSVSDLVRRVDGMEEFIKGQQSEQPALSESEIEKQVAESPDVIEVAEELDTIKADYQEENAAYTDAITKLGKLDKEVARLEGKLEVAYEENRPPIAAELAAAQAKQERALERYQETVRNKKKLEAAFKRSERRLEKAKRSAIAEIDKQTKAQRADAKAAEEVRQEFAEAMLSEARDYNIDPRSERYQSLFDTVQSRLWAYTSNLPEDADPLNIPVAVKTLVQDVLSNIGGVSFQKKSQAKRQTLTKGRPQKLPDANARKPTKGKRPTKDAAYWDRRAQRLLGG